MQHPTTPLPLRYATYPNETRLRELLDLQQRRQGTQPAPGAYDGVVPPPRRTTFRRPADPALDGPFFPDPSDPAAPQEHTRAREIAALIRNPGDSGVAPGRGWARQG